MCRFFYLPCQSELCKKYAQEYFEVCDKDPKCQACYIPQPYFCGERWCYNCLADGTWFAWKHLEMQIRPQNVYLRWIATLAAANSLDPMHPLPLFTALHAVGLQPPALKYFHIASQTLFYSLPFGLQEQDLTPAEKSNIPLLLTLTEITLEAMDSHRRALRRFHGMLEEFLIKIGLGKLPVGEKILRRREGGVVQPQPAGDNRRRQREVGIFIPKPAGANRLTRRKGPVV